MNNDIATLDFYNSSFYIRLDGCEYYADDLSKFRGDIPYPYEDINLLSYEPGRNIFSVEKHGGVVETGSELEPIAWLTDNRPSLLAAINRIAEVNKPIVTLEMQRALSLLETDWLVQRHQEELLLQTTPTLDDLQIRALLDYKQELRKLTQRYPKDQPAETVDWPQKPFNF